MERMNMTKRLEYLLYIFHETIVHLIFLKYEALSCKVENYRLYIPGDAALWNLTYDDLFLDGTPLVDINHPLVNHPDIINNN